MYSIQVTDNMGKVKQSASGANFARHLCTIAYEEGDSIIFLADAQHCVVQADQSLPEAMVYLPEKKLTYKIPKGEFALAYPPLAFAGDRHLMQIRPAREEELRTRRNLAFNPLDQRFYENCYPTRRPMWKQGMSPLFLPAASSTG